MHEIPNPFRGLVSSRIATYFDEAYGEYAKGRIRGAYDYGMLALNSTVFELRPGREPLFARLEALVADGKLGKDVLDLARSEEFLVKHDRGITDMDLSYMTVDDTQAFFRFLERFYLSLGEHGAPQPDPPLGT